MNSSPNFGYNNQQRSSDYEQNEETQVRTESPIEIDQNQNDIHSPPGNMVNAQYRNGANSNKSPLSGAVRTGASSYNQQDSMTVYQHGQQHQSEPEAGAPPIYPTPVDERKPTAKDFNDMRNDPEYMAFKAWQEQQKTGIPGNMVPKQDKPNEYQGPSGSQQQMYPYQGHGALAEQRHYQQSPAMHPEFLSYQQHGYYPPYRSLPGNRYGKITTSGNAKVIRGNVIDSRTHPAFVRDHEYGDAQINGDSHIIDGNIRPEDLKEFWNRP